MKNRTEARAIAATDRRFAKIDALLIEIGGLWADENEYFVGRAEELRQIVAEARGEVQEQVDSLRQEREERAAEEARAS